MRVFYLGLLAVIAGLVVTLAVVTRPEAAVPAPARMQRMLIGAGCYRIAGHATGLATAYCLDQAGTAPGRGMILGETPALGSATVSAGGSVMSLKTALARHLLRIEGTDTPDRLSLVNLTGQTLSFCVGKPVVIMGSGVAYSLDLARIYDRIAALMRQEAPAAADAPSTDTPDRHDRLQQRLWSLVNAADERALGPAWPLTGTPTDDWDACIPRENETILCR